VNDKKVISKKKVPYLFILPALLFFAGIYIFPVFFGLEISLTKWDLISPNRQFIGLKNYINLISEPLFIKSLRNTLYYIILTIPATIVFSLTLALMLCSQFIKFKPFFRVIYFIPVITSWVAISFIWKWLYQPSYGLINYFLSLIGIPPQGWLSSLSQAMPAIAITSIWKMLGFDMVIFIAGLQAIPRTFYEAAEIDGANRLQQFLKITLPLLNPTLVFILITSMISSFQVFVPVFVMTQDPGGQPGGPLNSTRVIVYHLYSIAFRELKMGYAAAISFVLFGIILVVSLLQLKVLHRRVEY
jgi:multiple sugar transport system permease protein